jgi:tetratricopeptide (TPR) repeat protein
VYLSLASVVATFVVLSYKALKTYSHWLFFILILTNISLTYLRNEDYRSSTSIWQDTVQKLPWNIRARSNLGLELIESKRPEEAVAILEETINMRRKLKETSVVFLPAGWDSDLQAALGAALFESGRTIESIAPMTEACKLNPKNRDAHFNLGSALEKLEKHHESIPYFEAALNMNAQDIAARGAVFRAYIMTRAFQNAERVARELVGNEPSNVEWLTNLADTITLQGRYAEARDLYEKVLRVDPGNQRAAGRLKQFRSI